MQAKITLDIDGDVEAQLKKQLDLYKKEALKKITDELYYFINTVLLVKQQKKLKDRFNDAGNNIIEQKRSEGIYNLDMEQSALNSGLGEALFGEVKTIAEGMLMSELMGGSKGMIMLPTFLWDKAELDKREATVTGSLISNNKFEVMGDKGGSYRIEASGQILPQYYWRMIEYGGDPFASVNLARHELLNGTILEYAVPKGGMPNRGLAIEPQSILNTIEMETNIEIGIFMSKISKGF
jgi:hypothetical protein